MFVISTFNKDYKLFNEKYNFIFNSYYETIGDKINRPKRGTLSRPTVDEIYSYRKHIDEEIINLINKTDDKDLSELSKLIELGLHHEMQHQELLYTDIKYIFAVNPLKPVYSRTKIASGNKIFSNFVEFQGRLIEIGYGENKFSFDNEKPLHKVFINDFKLQNRLITNEEYLKFINDGGYLNPVLWLSDGWDIIQKENWIAPLYWEEIDNEWYAMTLSGLRKLELNEPVCHVSYYEADAYARWSKKRLPTEAEWEHAVSGINIDFNFCNLLENKIHHPVCADKNESNKLFQMIGDVWEWTSSPYTSYPGYKQPKGAFGEYNAKFMCNQMVLRGGSCVTPAMHIRKTYRNFFQCDKRWQFTGIRLASDF